MNLPVAPFVPKTGREYTDTGAVTPSFLLILSPLFRKHNEGRSR